MSRVGKNPVAVPSGVTVAVDGRMVTAKGKLGELKLNLGDQVTAKLQDGKLSVRRSTTPRRRGCSGAPPATSCATWSQGVSQGFTKNLEINGVGYRAAVQGKTLQLQLGYSHDVNYPIPEGIQIKCEKPTAISITGLDKQKVGQVAAEIRSYRGPEPYKGKGIKYEGETILRKEGKKK